MRPGITVQHQNLPERRAGLVRCDIAGLIGLVSGQRLPEGATPGDYVELVLRRASDFWEHPKRQLFSPSASRSVGFFFDNGGQILHLFGVCVPSLEDLTVEATLQGVLAPLMQRLRVEEDIALLLAPDLAYLPCSMERGGAVRYAGEVVWDALLLHCAEMGNRFFVMDSPRGLHGELLMGMLERFATHSPKTRSFGAVYYPWLSAGDGYYPPSGAMAGVYARVEREHGPFGVAWPPANVTVRGVSDLEVRLDWDESGELAERNVNPLVLQTARGVVVWGGRTLSTDPDYRNINSRRVVSMVSEQLRRDNEWAVFEQNNSQIWAVLERNARIRMEEFWRAGLITSEAPKGDYLVQCDRENNPRIERDAGKLNVRVRLRPIGMTEHVTIDLRLGESGT